METWCIILGLYFIMNGVFTLFVMKILSQSYGNEYRMKFKFLLMTIFFGVFIAIGTAKIFLRALKDPAYKAEVCNESDEIFENYLTKD